MPIVARILDKLERRFRPYVPRQITLILIVLQVITYLFQAVEPQRAEGLLFIPAKVLNGEWWRLFTFLLQPPVTNPLFAFIIWHLWYLMGTVLEIQWGRVRYALFLLIGYLATVSVAFFVPDQLISNAFLEGSVFLAFAWRYPEFEVRVFFLLPVKVKWLALLAWIIYGWTVIFGDWPARLVATAAVLNFLLFFGGEIISRARHGHRRMSHQREQIIRASKPFHTCAVCGITDKTNPEMEFRYCSKCTGTRGYCSEHLRNHEHV